MPLNKGTKPNLFCGLSSIFVSPSFNFFIHHPIGGTREFPEGFADVFFRALFIGYFVNSCLERGICGERVIPEIPRKVKNRVLVPQ